LWLCKKQPHTLFDIGKIVQTRSRCWSRR